MKDLISNANNILIIVNAEYNLDAYAASVALFRGLKENLGKKVRILKHGFVPLEYDLLVSTTGVAIDNQVPQQRYVVTFDKSDGGVDDVKWKDSNDRLTLIITPKYASFDLKNIQVAEKGEVFDLVITIGFQKIEDLLKVNQKLKNGLLKERIVNIDNHPFNKHYGSVNLTSTRCASISESVFSLLFSLDVQIAEDAANALLSGICWQTDSLRLGVRDESTANIYSMLVEKGARIDSIVQKLYKSSDEKFLHLLDKLISESSLEGGKISSVILDSSGLEKVGLDFKSNINPDFNPLWRNKNVEICLVLVTQDEKDVFGSLVSFNRDINLFELISDYYSFGNLGNAKFLVKGKSIDKIEKEVIEKCRLKLGIKQIMSVNTVKKTQKTPEISDQKTSAPLQKAETPPPVVTPLIKPLAGNNSESLITGQPLSPSFTPFPSD